VERPHYPRISRRQDPVVTRFREVTKHHGEGDEVVLDGVHLLLDALRAGITVDVVVASTDLLDDPSTEVQELWQLARHAQVPVHEATTAVIEAASPVRTPSGVVAIARWSLSPLTALWTPAPALVLGLVDVQDPGNAGAVIRSADGLGATGVVMIGATADPASAKTMRGAMGSSFRVPVARASLGETTRAARAAGLQVVATTAPASSSTELHAADLTGPLLVLLGNEGAGLPEHILRTADFRLSIDMRPGINSFNVAVTSALVLYEARLQRGAPRGQRGEQ
jgi:TrmH family RNA methyltransferase